MNIPNLIVMLFLFAAGSAFGVIASFLTGTFNHLVINKFMNESLFRNMINLFLILVFLSRIYDWLHGDNRICRRRERWRDISLLHWNIGVSLYSLFDRLLFD